MYKERYKTAKFIDFVNFNPLSAKGSIWIPQVQPYRIIFKVLQGEFLTICLKYF